MTVDDLRAKPGHLVRRLHQISSALFAQELANVDITPVQFAALVVIADRPGSDATAVSGLIAYDRATIGGVLDRLEAKGLVRRQSSTQDRRVKVLAATDAGLRCIADVQDGVKRVQDRLLSPLDTADRQHFVRLLAQLVAGYETAD